MLFVLFGSVFVTDLEHTLNRSTAFQLAEKTSFIFEIGQQSEFLTSRPFDANDGVQTLMQTR